MSPPAVSLQGTLARHARRLTLSATLGAEAVDLPGLGTAVAFAKDFQAEEDLASAWLSWVDKPGRLLLLVPPFGKGGCGRPVTWEARRCEALAGSETELGRVLARERQHELRGGLMPLDRSAGQVLTGCWRRHPLSGLVVVTALPVWSLLSLEHREAARSWMADLYAQAGTPTADEDEESPSSEVLGGDDWTLLLHLAGSAFSTREEALDALASSAQFTLPPETAQAAMGRLARQGLIDGAGLTARGESALVASPYGAWLREIRRNRDVR